WLSWFRFLIENFSSFALNSVDKSLRAFCADVRGVRFIGVDVHREFEVWIDPNQDVAENQFAVASHADAHERFVAHAVTQRVLRRHVNVTQRANHSLIDLHTASGTFQSATRRIFNIAALANRRMNAELELFGHRNLDLSVFARRAENANAIDFAFWS